jgi:hypothetical protein
MATDALTSSILNLTKAIREIQEEVEHLRRDLHVVARTAQHKAEDTTQERIRQASQELFEMIMWDTRRLDAIEERLDMPLTPLKDTTTTA